MMVAQHTQTVPTFIMGRNFPYSPLPTTTAAARLERREYQRPASNVSVNTRVCQTGFLKLGLMAGCRDDGTFSSHWVAVAGVTGFCFSHRNEGLANRSGGFGWLGLASQSEGLIEVGADRSRGLCVGLARSGQCQWVGPAGLANRNAVLGLGCEANRSDGSGWAVAGPIEVRGWV